MNRKKCRNCKEYFRPERTLQHYCLEPECVKAWIKSEKEKEWKLKKKKLKEDLKTSQDWMNEAQKVFNKYIRLRDKDKPCISCGNPKPKKVNAGHFYSSGGHKFLTFDESNVHLQCEHCNSFLSGNLHDYRKNIVQRIGLCELQRLDREAQKTAKYTVEELKELINTYKGKIKALGK